MSTPTSSTLQNFPSSPWQVQCPTHQQRLSTFQSDFLDLLRIIKTKILEIWISPASWLAWAWTCASAPASLSTLIFTLFLIEFYWIFEFWGSVSGVFLIFLSSGVRFWAFCFEYLRFCFENLGFCFENLGFCFGNLGFWTISTYLKSLGPGRPPHTLVHLL